MTAAEVQEEYDKQVIVYNAINGIRTAIVSIQGTFEAASFYFDLADKRMGECIEHVDSATIVVDQFEYYRGILGDSKDITYTALNKFSSEYDTMLNNAFDAAESDLEKVWSYLSYLDKKYNYGSKMEEAGQYAWSREYEPFNGNLDIKYRQGE